MNSAVAFHTKILGDAHSLRYRQRYEGEIRLIRAIGNRPGLPCFVSHGMTPTGKAFVSYRRLPGVTLEQHLAPTNDPGAEPQNPPPDWLSFAIGLLNCVIQLHEHRPPIFHGDVSARNVLIDHHGNVGLIDFGVARSRCLPFNIRFRSSQSVAAPRFMSPEQAQGRFWGSPSDIYQVGLAILAMITGILPNLSLSTDQIIAQLRHDPSQSQHNAAALSGFAGRFLYSLLDPCPASRPGAREALATLTQAQNVWSFTRATR